MREKLRAREQGRLYKLIKGDNIGLESYDEQRPIS